MNINELIKAAESVGCTIKEFDRMFHILMPGNFPWYCPTVVRKADNGLENSRLIAIVEKSKSDECSIAQVWPLPYVHMCIDEPLGIMMGPGTNPTSALDALNNCNAEQFATWLENRIGEVSVKAKEYHKLVLKLHSKEYEV